MTPLHVAAWRGHTQFVQLLLDRGCAIDVRDKYQKTPLHYAAWYGQPQVVELLLDRGCPIDVRDQWGETPLRLACDDGHLDVVRSMLERARQGSIHTEKHGRDSLTETNLFDDIADVVKLKERNSDVLDAVCQGWREQRTRGESLTDVPTEVLDAGAQDVRSFFKFLQHSGASYRKKLCVIGPSCWGKTSLIKTLTTGKATRERIDTRTIGIDRFRWSFETPATESSKGRVYEVSLLDFAGQEEYQSAHTIFYSKRTLYVVCVNVKAYSDRLKSHKIASSGQPNEAMDAFFDETIYSRIRAVCAREPESEFAFVGTKLDLVRYSDECVQRVGDDVLARFRRRDADEIRALDRTLDGLKRGPQDGAVTDAAQTKLTRLELLRRQRPKILTRKFVAMSSANTKRVADVRDELQHSILSGDSAFLMPAEYTSVGRYLRKIVRGAKEDKSLTAQINAIFVHSDELVKRLLKEPKFASLDANDVASILRVLHALGDILWFDKTGGELSDVVFLSPDLVIDFVRKVINHELGERRPGCFMWLGSPRGLSAIEKAVKNEGRVAHKLLMSLALWRDVTDDKLMLQLKELMFHFQLAYPAGVKRLQFDSDLIVPVYWKKNGKAQSIPRQSPTMTAVATWDYDFENGLPESLFDRLGVVSYSAIYSNDRFFSRDSFGTMTDVYWAKVSKHSEEDDDTTVGSSTLRIHIAATSPLTAWKQLKWYVMSVERVLEEYSGLWVLRYAVSKGGQRIELDQLVEERQERLAVDSTDDSSASELLPPWIDWFMRREWQNVGKKHPETTSAATTESSSSEPSLTAYEKQMIDGMNDLKRDMKQQLQGVHTHLDENDRGVHKHLDEVQDTAITLAAAEGNRRDYPALWTLSYREEAATSIYELELRSELSGKCYHDPIPIVVPNGFFRKYDVVIKTGLSVLCALMPDMLGKGVVEYLASSAADQIDRAVEVHSLVDGLDIKADQNLEMEKNRTLSPDATVALLRDFLKIADESFDPLKMSTISGLECGIYEKAVGQRKTGEHLWAHRSEIEAQRDTIRFRHDYHGDAVRVDRVLPQIVDSSPAGTTAAMADDMYINGRDPQFTTIVAKDEASVDIVSSNKEIEEVRDAAVAVVSQSAGTNYAGNATFPGIDVTTTATPVPADACSVEITVEIVKATNLPDVRLVGTQSPFCTWKILDSHGNSIASGQTQPHIRGGCHPNWSGQLSRMAMSVKTLKGCVLVAAVKTETAIGSMTEVIADGTYAFTESVPSTGKPCEFNLVLLSKGEPAGSLTFRLES